MAHKPFDTSTVLADIEPPLMGRELIAAAPERMVWGTNWPHPPIHDNLPDEAVCLDALYELAGGEAQYKRILVDNPAKLYGFGAL